MPFLKNIEDLGEVFDPEKVMNKDPMTRKSVYLEIAKKMKCLKSLHFLSHDIRFRVEFQRNQENESIVTRTQIQSKRKTWKGTGSSQNTLYSVVESLTNMQLRVQ